MVPHGNLQNQVNEKRLTIDNLKDRGLDAVLEITNLLTLTGNLKERIPPIMALISNVLGAERSTLFILSDEHQQLRLQSCFAQDHDDEISINLHMGVVGASVLNGKLINVSNAYEDFRFNSKVDRTNALRTESILSVPIKNTDGDVLGAVEFINKRTGPFTPNDETTALESLTAFADIFDQEGAGTEKGSELLIQLIEALNCRGGTLFRVNRDSGDLDSIASEGLGDKALSININLGIAGTVAVTGEEIIINDAHEDKRFNCYNDLKSGFTTRQLLCAPLKNNQGKIIAVAQVINKKIGSFNSEDLALLNRLSTLIAVFIENSILIQEYQFQYQSFLEVMAASIDAKDPLTASHSKKVKEYAVRIAMQLGYSEKDLEVLSVAAWLHDYGKIGIKEDVLTKQGALNDEERLHINQHAGKTKEILDKMYFPKRLEQVPFIAASHHERLDGSGYCEGLKDAGIPYFAKIIAVADVFDALTADRHYRKALTPEKAFEIMEQDAGSKLDKDIIGALKRLILDGEFNG